MSLIKSVRHALKLDRETGHEDTSLINSTRVNLLELEQSQDKLKSSMANSGFFLGDALTIKRSHNERPRTVHRTN